MSFVQNLAKGGLFGLGGLAATGALKGKKPAPTLATTTTGGSTIDPSLINRKTVY